MNSFYGGPAGKSFAIKQVFTSKNGLTNSLAQDLALGWFSLIGVGDYVVVSYGLPSEENYEIFKKIDLDAEGVSYNSTLWEKCYDENNKQAENGLSYKLIASLTGNTPKFKIKTPVTVLDAGKQPDVKVDNTDVDQPVLEFSLPQGQVLSMKQPVNKLNANEDPRVVYSEEDINKPTLEFFLPQSQVIQSAQLEETLPVGSTPEVRLDSTGEDGVNHPVIKFKLPASQKIDPTRVTTHEINADQEPRVEFGVADPNNPTLDFYLPQSQILAQPVTVELGPDGVPHVTLDSRQINSPQYTFELPRAVKFYYGTLLGRSEGGPFTETDEAFAEYGVGDYYINVPSGYIYKVTAVEAEQNQATFTYVACLQAPKPAAGASPVAPYTYNIDHYDPTNPTVDMAVSEEDHTWSLTFRLPKMPVPDVDKDFIAAPADPGSVGVEISDENTVKFNFKIPRGSRLFNGTEAPSAIDEAKNGDYYLNTTTGKLSKFNGSAWEEQTGTLQGPVGNILNIVKEYHLEESGDYKNTLENGTTAITADYPSPTPDQLFAVTWKNEGGDEISYWQYRTKEGTWDRVQLTGGISSVLVKEYSTDDTKAYNTTYVNSLIGDTEDNKDKSAYSKQAVEKLLTWRSFSELEEG